MMEGQTKQAYLELVGACQPAQSTHYGLGSRTLLRIRCHAQHGQSLHNHGPAQ